MGYHDWKFHCAVLGVPEHSSPEEIKDAFRQLALRFHPDRNGGTSQAKEKFQRINASYRFLMKNLASRPPVTTPDPPPSSPLHSAPPPIPPQYKRQVLRSPGDSTRKIYPGFLQQQKTRFRSVLPDFRSKATRRTLVAAFCMIVAFVSTRYILRSTPEWQVPETALPADRPKVKRDSEGRMLARCDHLSFSSGNLVKKWSGELSENECGHNCRTWFDVHEDYDGSCLWNGKEFHQHAAARENNRSVASPIVGGGSWQVRNQPQVTLHATFVADAEPEYEGRITTIRKDVRLGEVDVLELDYVPSVWIGDKRLLQGREGATSQRIILTPIRKGVTGVVLLDEQSKPRLKIIYDIQ